MIQNYKPNSHRSKEERHESAGEKRANPVVKKGAVNVKPNNARKFADMFVSGDIDNVKDYLLNDVVFPALKKLLFDSIKDGAEMLIFGKTGRGGRSSSNSNYVSYRSYSDSRDRDYNRDSRSTNRFNYEDLVFTSKGEAEAVLAKMCDILAEYKIVRVLDLYDLCEMTPPYTSQNYGWTNLDRAESIRVRDGYALKLPKAMPID